MNKDSVRYSDEAWERRQAYQREYVRKRRATDEGRKIAKEGWDKYYEKVGPEVKRKQGLKALKKWQMMKLYGLTMDEWQALVKGGCEVCGAMNNLCVDHCHTSGKVRGCLCGNCNSALGFMKDDSSRLIRAAEYLLRKSN